MSLAEILKEALMDEIKARDTYRRIIDTYGPVRPFANIVEAEQRHIEMLLPLFERYGIAVPEARDPARISVPGSLLEACQAAVRAEINNMAMYDRLMAETELVDVRAVLLRLQAASRDHHLPSFQRCVERGGAAGTGPGPGGGRGRGPGRGYGDGRGRGFGAGRGGSQ
jgi:rubrerythrin